MKRYVPRKKYTVNDFLGQDIWLRFSDRYIRLLSIFGDTLHYNCVYCDRNGIPATTYHGKVAATRAEIETAMDPGYDYVISVDVYNKALRKHPRIDTVTSEELLEMGRS